MHCLVCFCEKIIVTHCASTSYNFLSYYRKETYNMMNDGLCDGESGTQGKKNEKPRDFFHDKKTKRPNFFTEIIFVYEPNFLLKFFLSLLSHIAIILVLIMFDFI